MHAKITQAPEGVEYNRWLENHSNEQHHKLKCISSSQLKYLAAGKSMAAFYNKHVLRNDKPFFSDEFRIGTIAHLAVLEPEKFEKTVIVCGLDQRKKEFKDFLKELTGDNESSSTKNGGILNSHGDEVFIIKQDEMDMYRAYQKQFEEHKRLNVMMPDCTIEQTGVAQDPETGLWLSLRGDARSARGYFIDPKTIAEELSLESISRYMAAFHLHIQDAHYIETANLIEPDSFRQFFFVMMSKKPPYEIALIQLDGEARAYGKKKRRQLLNQIAECEFKGKWPALDFNDNQWGLHISLPPWSMR